VARVEGILDDFRPGIGGGGRHVTAEQMEEMGAFLRDAARRMSDPAYAATDNRQESADQLDRLFAHLGSCTPAARKALADAVVAHMDHLAVGLDIGEPYAVNTRAAINEIMADREAREKLTKAAGEYARAEFDRCFSQLGPALAGGQSVEHALGDTPEVASVFSTIGKMLHAVAAWDGGKPSEAPGLLGAGFGLALSGAGMIVTGGWGSIALAAVGAGAGRVEGAASAAGAGRGRDRAAVHAQSVSDTMYYMAAAALLLSPGPPPLMDHLVDTPPNPKDYPKLYNEDGVFEIPPPASDNWVHFHEWCSLNPKLKAAVDGIMVRTGFAPE